MGCILLSMSDGVDYILDTFGKILSEIMIGKNSIMAKINESKIISKNIKVQRVHESTKYERDQLIEIAHKCKQDNHYKIINKETLCQNKRI